MEENSSKQFGEKIKLTEINLYLTCYLCKGYLIDATTISECLHSFCRSCIIRFLQDNSYCPVCEMIINKAKPNLKLDKTLQDIVYKLVPELFLREMTRRKLFYQQYPQIAARVTPEERGEDTERTIFNPQDCISLSMEYVSDDSSPGAIRLPELKNESTDKSLTSEENQVLMKRYLQCPGMCRVEVLKKFVRNKYNVDTNLFHIDILYKKVPLPDHYTLIDIAYIYSWKRNEPMKFFFRITDLNNVGEKFDIFNIENPLEFVVKPPTRTHRTNGDRTRSNRRREGVGKSRKHGRTSKRASQGKIEICDKIKQDDVSGKDSADERTCASRETIATVDSPKSETENVKQEVNEQVNNNNMLTQIIQNSDNIDAKHKVEYSREISNDHKFDPKFQNNLPCKVFNEIDCKNTESSKMSDLDNVNISNQDQENKENKNEQKVSCKPTKVAEVIDTTTTKEQVSSSEETKSCIKSDVPQVSSDIQNDENVTKNAVYTNITLKRTDNVEIFTKIQKVSNKEGRPIGLNIIKQTIKKNSTSKSNNSRTSTKSTLTINKIPKKASEEYSISSSSAPDIDEQKRIFLQTFDLKAKTPSINANDDLKLKTSNINANVDNKEKETEKQLVIQKRKNSSPVKNDKSKKPKLDKKPTKKIIIQYKSNKVLPTIPNPVQTASTLQNTGLQSLIENCKIPSSLSITIKESSDDNKQLTLPPVKNYIEILKLPDDNGSLLTNKSKETPLTEKLEFPLQICDNDSEQKVDQDLAEIARSLTEKIPMSTTISQIVGPKPQFPIPTKQSVSLKQPILPSPVPELSSKLLNIPKDATKLAPRSPQTFQKIFEESIKKPDGSSKTTDKDQKSALDLSSENVTSTSNSKRNILEIASQLFKKTKLELEKNHVEVSSQPSPVGKVPIPRLSQKNVKLPQKNLKFDLGDTINFPQTVTNLHSNALGLNYTVSVGPNMNAMNKINGTVSTITKECPVEHLQVTDAKSTVSQSSFSIPKEKPSSSPKPSPIPRNLSPGIGYNSPRNSPKHSPKSSPVIKHMYAPTPNLLMDPLRVNTFNHKVSSPKFGDLSKQSVTSPNLPSPSSSKMSLSPKLSPGIPKLSLSPSLSPKTPMSAPTTPSSSTKPQENGDSSSSLPTTTSLSIPNQMSPSQILEKYNIQNLAQLTASLNFNPANFNLNPGNQLAAIQHAMLLKHFEMQNRQNWLNMNQGPLLQYEKYLQSLKTNQNHLLGNIKEN